ncbi:hypothetical protein H5410_037685 [Solanum commersonii]|uniref:Enoyl reductase (ER) domain-containing protein n=1 Tax=Solanum commersonii TaxID=4109 RepID=A0A9J5Y8K5_SOLCO|nr:hypothetical protein H5410_037685 [Solanum commersonii]
MATAEVENREWYVASYASTGVPNSDHIKLRTVTLSLRAECIPDHHVVFQILYVSIDPYMRTQLSGLHDGLSLPQIPLGQVIRAFGIGKVVRSKDAKFSEGEIVTSRFCPVSEFGVLPSNLLQKIKPDDGVALPDYLSSLGMPGMTAWVGIEKIGNAKEGSNVYISAAAGGVGIIAGQLAKVKGCRVVGSVGSDYKVKLLKEECGYDEAFNYRIETDYDAALTKYFPDGIDVYFDNVGGKMLEAVLNHVNHGARIALCGMISEYNKVWTEREGVRNLLNMVGKEVMMKGFMVPSYFNHFEEFIKEMGVHLKEGKIKICTTKMATEVESREWYIASYAPIGVPNSDHIKLRTVTLSLRAECIPNHHVAFQILYVSIDPYMRTQLSGLHDGLSLPQIPLGHIGNAKEGSNVFISAAAGGVGIIAGQLAKVKGCRVVGSVKLLKEECGYDEAFNYRIETDYDAALTKYFPDGIDVYFDNVGGKMLEAVLNHVNHGARIALCGMISEYNKVWTEREGVRNLLNMVGKEVMMKGFMVGSYYNHFEEFFKEMEIHLKEGKIKSKHKIYNGIESFFLASLFSSSNVGKVILQVAS